MTRTPPFLRFFAARGIFWRHCLDWAVRNVPFYLQPFLLFMTTGCFFIFAAPIRRALVANLTLAFPRASRLRIYLRAYRVLINFAWTITEAAHFRLTQCEFDYELVGEEFLDQLGREKGAIVLTAHMGSYDCGAAIFAQKFGRDIRVVRAPEGDAQSAQHLQGAFREAAGSAVRVDYSGGGALLSFDLLAALRGGEIVSIQGDRVVPGLAHAAIEFFGRPVPLPTGPFTLALVAEVPIYPLFFLRTGHRRYQIITHPPFRLERSGQARDEDVARGLELWRDVLESMIAQHWPQWFALVPILPADAQG